LIKTIREKLKIHKRWKLSGLACDYNEFSMLRSRQKQLQKQCYSHYITQTENAIKTDPKKLHNYVKSQEPHTCYPQNMFYRDISSSDTRTVCDLFGEFFDSSFQATQTSITPEVDVSSEIDVGVIRFETRDISLKLKNLDLTKGAGPDGIPPLFIVTCSEELAPILSILYRKSYTEGVFPAAWKTSFITPIHKSGDRHSVENYRPISKLSLCRNPILTLGLLFEKLLEGKNKSV
jgi:hypothetical protein